MNHVIGGEGNDPDSVPGLVVPKVKQAWVRSTLLVPQLLKDPGDMLIPGIGTIGESIARFLQAKQLVRVVSWKSFGRKFSIKFPGYHVSSMK